jgi:hypothetical protein
MCLDIALMMEAVSSSQKLVNIYETTRRNNPEDSHLQVAERLQIIIWKAYWRRQRDQL